MASRLDLVNSQIKKETKIVSSSFDFLNLGSLLTPEENVPPFILSKSERRFATSSKLKSRIPSFPTLKRLSFPIISFPSYSNSESPSISSRNPMEIAPAYYFKESFSPNSQGVMLESPP
jgi:hypothetical protein